MQETCPKCEGKGAFEVMVPGKQGYDRYPLPNWEWHKCDMCDGTGYLEPEL
jgi:DnaJ-class molecular chaperone